MSNDKNSTSNAAAVSADTQNSNGGDRKTGCTTGLKFIWSIHGYVNIIIIVALVCVLISVGLSDANSARVADMRSAASDVKIKAYETRNAIFAFAIIGALLIIIDSVLHVTGLISRLPILFDTIFIISMFVLAGIYLILGCCAAAWEKKLNDTEFPGGSSYQRKGAAAAASFFLFASMFAIGIGFIFRLYRPTAIVSKLPI